MAQITLTLDLTHEAVDALHTLVDALGEKPTETERQLTLFDDSEEKKPVKPARTTKPKEKPAEDLNLYCVAPKMPDEQEEKTAPTVSKSDVRAVALNFSKAGKQKELKTIFAKYGAEKLSDIPEEKYGELMADLEAVNG